VDSGGGTPVDIIAYLDIIVLAKRLLRSHMKSAAISKLKASLSEYLDRVKAGEEVIVTERGRAGLVKLGSGRLPKKFWNASRPNDSQGAAVRSLSEERESGR